MLGGRCFESSLIDHTALFFNINFLSKHTHKNRCSILPTFHLPTKKNLQKKVMRNIIYGTLAAGCLAYFMQLLKQPLILGYLLGGVLVGPIGLRLIIDEHEIATMSLGLHAR